ncbi:MAG: hypothetical protein Fur0032_20850 [Terrimicrobiaceae bacterium]
MTIQQERKYWREWAQACRVQGWPTSAEQQAQRKAWHARLGLPESHKHWSHANFSRWISGTAHLRDVVDIRDRERESVQWTIDRLRQALTRVLGTDEYAKSIMLGLRDTHDTDQFPTQDPADPRDLVNLRNTLHNRLGRLIQRIRDGEVKPGPDCPPFGDLSQAAIIENLIHGRSMQARRKYSLAHTEPGTTRRPPTTTQTYSAPAPARRTSPPAAPPAAPAPATGYCMHPLPKPTLRPAHTP